MTLQFGPIAGVVRTSLGGLRILRCNNTVRGVGRGLVLVGALLWVGVHGHAPARCQGAAADGSVGVRVLGEEGITASAQAVVSVRRTARVVDVRVLRGQVLVRPQAGVRRTGGYPVVVTGRNARVRSVDASVCVGWRERGLWSRCWRGW